jgi:hypothetical protein
MKILQKEKTGTQSPLCKGYVPSKVLCTCYYIVSLYVFVAGEDALLQATHKRKQSSEKQSLSLKFEPILLSFF